MSGLASFLLCLVMLSAPDTVLIERNLGKRIDPQTGGMPISSCICPPCGISEVSGPSHGPHPSLSARAQLREQTDRGPCPLVALWRVVSGLLFSPGPEAESGGPRPVSRSGKKAESRVGARHRVSAQKAATGLPVTPASSSVCY